MAEVADQDVLQRSVCGMAVVGNDRRLVNAILDKAIDFIETLNDTEIVDCEIELIAF